MKQEISTVGSCLYCQEMISKQGMTKHLASHFKTLEKENSSGNFAFHLIVSSEDYFLHLLMNAEVTLDVLDLFLRDIWLECCRHMSAFSIRKMNMEVDKEVKARDIFEDTNKLVYDYDFGTTTRLDIEMKGGYNIPVIGIALISRNEPFPIMCRMCQKKPATGICRVHINNGFYCDSCGKKHAKECADFEEYAKMPVVNSPRTGECDYRGGSIDKERDGCYKENKRGKSK